MSITSNGESIGRIGDEPTGGVKYLSDGATLRGKIAGSRRENVSAAGTRFLAASGGDACLVVAGPLVSEAGNDDRSTETAVARCCTARFGYPGEAFEATIDLVLDTFGGSLDTAFKTVNFLSRFTKRLRVFVPRRAKSAGTLIAIGSYELYMSPFAELGPLDTQIRDPRNPTDRVSALDCYQSVDYVRTFGLNTLNRTFRALAGETRALIPLSQLINTSATFSIGSIAPILTQVNALDFGGWGRTLRIGEMYAQTLLSRAGYSEDESKEIAHQLVYGYTHHPYAIDVDEASRMGLRPLAMSQEQYESALDIVTGCAEPGTVVIGFADGNSELLTQGARELGAEQAAKGTERAGARGNTADVPGGSRQAAPVGWIEEGERPSRDERERAVDQRNSD
jgi:Serine dehydrogenase proteinase